MNVAVRTNDRFVNVDGLNLRYLEEGSGVPAILLHGSSLGSSADVFRRNLRALGANGVRAIALDLPGFGKSSPAEDLGGAYRNKIILGFMDALGLKQAALDRSFIGRRSRGNIALAHPDRVSHVMVLGTGSLLPPLEAGRRPKSAAARERRRRGWKSAWCARSRRLRHPCAAGSQSLPS